MHIQEIKSFLITENVDFQLIEQDAPIRSVDDAKKYYDICKAAQTFILENENGLVACIVSSGHGCLDFEDMKKQFGFSKLNMASRTKVAEQTSYKIRAIPLIGHGLPCIFDDKFFGGTDKECIALKISLNRLKG